MKAQLSVASAQLTEKSRWQLATDNWPLIHHAFCLHLRAEFCRGGGVSRRTGVARDGLGHFRGQASAGENFRRK